MSHDDYERMWNEDRNRERLRDEMAMAALTLHFVYESIDDLAVQCYAVADAMLKARETK
jgi:hypothetical protein